MAWSLLTVYADMRGIEHGYRTFDNRSWLMASGLAAWRVFKTRSLHISIFSP